MKLSMKIYGRHSSLCLPKAGFSQQPVSPGSRCPPSLGVSQALKSVLPPSRAALTCAGSLSCQEKMQSHRWGPAVDLTPTSRCKRNTRTKAGVMHTSQRNLCFLCHSLADCKKLATGSLPCLALLSPALLVEIPGGE